MWESFEGIPHVKDDSEPLLCLGLSIISMTYYQQYFVIATSNRLEQFHRFDDSTINFINYFSDVKSTEGESLRYAYSAF